MGGGGGESLMLLSSPPPPSPLSSSSLSAVFFQHSNLHVAAIAQLVARPTEKPGAILTRVRVPGVVRDFSPAVTVRTAPVVNRMHQHLCAR